MISEISGQRLEFSERVLVVAVGQRPAVEDVIQSCNCKVEWSSGGSAIEPYCDFRDGSGVGVWSMSVVSKEDASLIQSALDAVVYVQSRLVL
jgi:hypothetical protein